MDGVAFQNHLQELYPSLLTIAIHHFIILLVVAGGDVVHPCLVVEVPSHGLLDAFLELQAGFPSELALELAAVDGVAQVVAGAVGDVGDEVEVGPFGTPQQAVHRLDEHLDDVDVLPLVEAADVVRLGYLSLVEDEVDGAGVVNDVEPVAHVLTLAIDGQRLAVAYVVDEQGDQLLGELVGAVVVRAVGHDSGQAVGVVEGAHEMVRAGLRGAVGRVRQVLQVLGEELLAVGQMVALGGRRGGEGRLYALGVRHLQRAIHLVGADVVEALALVLLRQRLPVELGGLQEREGAHDVGAGEGEGVLDAAVHVALGGQVDDAIDVLLLHQLVEGVEVADVHADKLVVRALLDVLQVGQVAGVSEFVEVDDVVVRVLRDEEADDMRTDEAGAASDDDVFHIRRVAKC